MMMRLLGATYVVWSILKVWVGMGWYLAVGYAVYLAWNGDIPWWAIALVWAAGWLLVLAVRFIEGVAFNAAMHVGGDGRKGD